MLSQMGISWFVGVVLVVLGFLWEALVVRRHFNSDTNFQLMRPVSWSFALVGAIANALGAFLTLPEANVFGFTFAGSIIGLFGAGLLTVRDVVLVRREKQSKRTWSVVLGFALSAAGFVAMTHHNLAPYM